jgi:hypothetical protein
VTVVFTHPWQCHLERRAFRLYDYRVAALCGERDLAVRRPSRGQIRVRESIAIANCRDHVIEPADRRMLRPHDRIVRVQKDGERVCRGLEIGFRDQRMHACRHIEYEPAAQNGRRGVAVDVPPREEVALEVRRLLERVADIVSTSLAWNGRTAEQDRVSVP